MIFYFSATGNCLYVARELAAALESAGSPQELVSIPQEMGRAGALQYADDVIGVVYPIFGHETPDMVGAFLKRATFDTPYFFLVPTYGCRHANAVEQVVGLLQAKEGETRVDPAYVSTLLMVDNWLPEFDMNEQRALIPEKHIDENLARIAADVVARKRWIEPVTDADRAAHEEFLARGLSFTPEHLKDFLVIDPEVCSGCGICSRVCPAGCITLEDGVAVRDALAGDGCNACIACIQACPDHAISLPMGEINPEARFRNEHVRLADLIKANCRL